MKTTGLTSILISMMLILGLASCKSSSTPKAVAEDAVNALLAEDIEKFYGYLCASDREAITIDNFKEKFVISGDLSKFSRLLPDQKTKLKAKNFKETVSNDIATVTCVLSVPDINHIGLGYLSYADLEATMEAKSRTLDELPDAVKAKIIEHISKDDMPTVDKIQQFNMVKEEDGWKIKLNIPAFIEAKKPITPFDL